MAEKKKSGKKYIVVFQDEDDTVLKTAFVPQGEAAPAPEMPAKKEVLAHHEIVFAGWDKDISRVEHNLTTKAVYKKVPKEYLVIYFHENNKILGMETVPYGSPARAALTPEKPGDEEFDYLFKGWSGAIDPVLCDTNAKAIFEAKRKQFPVRFYNEDGSFIKEEQVEYGGDASLPADPTRREDPAYRYVFTGWDRSEKQIKEPTDIYAEYEHIYKEYTVTFHDAKRRGKRPSQTVVCHYGDPVAYPAFKRKGYDLIWSPWPQTVDQDYELQARWEFANPAGKQVETEEGVFEVINPSVKNGSVRCLRYNSLETRVALPERVRLGDYFYRVEEVGPRAFCKCSAMITLKLPDTVREVGEQGLADCRKLIRVYLGKGLYGLGARVFSGDVSLKEIIVSGKDLRHCHDRALESLPESAVIKTDPKNRDAVKRMLRPAMLSHCCRIVTAPIFCYT